MALDVSPHSAVFFRNSEFVIPNSHAPRTPPPSTGPTLEDYFPPDRRTSPREPSAGVPLTPARPLWGENCCGPGGQRRELKGRLHRHLAAERPSGASLRYGTAWRPFGAELSPRRGRNTPAQGTAKRRQPRSAALGHQDAENQALKGRHKHAWIESCFALTGLHCEAISSPQGGAALCPGLICSGSFGANSAAARSGRVLFRPFSSRRCPSGHPRRVALGSYHQNLHEGIPETRSSGSVSSNPGGLCYPQQSTP